MTGRVLAPVEGDPEAVRGLARALRSGADRLAQVNGVLTGIKAGASWDSPAGEVFEAAVQQSPPVIDALIDRYAGAALALMTFADALETVQRQARASSEDHRSAWDDLRVLEELAVLARADPVAAEAVRRRQGEAMGRVMEAERAHARAWDDFRTADRHLARRLRALADDILDDAWHYSVFATGDRFGEELAAVPPALRRTSGTAVIGAAADAVGTASQVGLLVLYGEGSWKQLGVNTGARALGFGAQGIRTGALAGSRATSGLADGRRGYVGDELSTGQRFLVGTRDEIHRAQPRLARALDRPHPPSRLVVPRSPLPVMRATTDLPLGRKAQVWRAQAAAVVRRRADEAFLDDWRAATAGGRNAQVMFTAGTTLQHAVPRARSAVTGAVTEEPSERAGLPR